MEIKHAYPYYEPESYLTLRRGDMLGNCCGAHAVKTVNKNTRKVTSRGIKLFLGKLGEPYKDDKYTLDHVETSIGLVSVLVRKK